MAQNKSIDYYQYTDMLNTNNLKGKILYLSNIGLKIICVAYTIIEHWYVNRILPFGWPAWTGRAGGHQNEFCFDREEGRRGGTDD